MRVFVTFFLLILLPRIASAQPTPNTDRLLTLAEAYLVQGMPLPDSAVQLVDRVLREDPDDGRARALDLWIRYAHGRSFLPALRLERQRRAGLRLLAEDSTNAVAHLLLGAIQLDLYRNQKDRVSIPVRYADDNVMDLVIGYLDPRREDGRDLGIVRDTEKETTYAATAERHLRAAFRDLNSPLQMLAARHLAELALLTDNPVLGREAARAMRVRDPGDPSGHAVEALFQHRAGNRTAAWDAVVDALETADPDQRTAFLDRTPVEAPSTPDSGKDWLDDDPRWETPENERLIEHIARRTALRLLGHPEASDPGRMILRYGLPRETMRFSSDRDDFMAVSYPFTTFIFHDMAKTGNWIYWSSSAADLTGPRNVIRQWQRDQTIHAAEQFDSRPFVSKTGPTESIPMHASVHGFGPRDRREWVVGWCVGSSAGHRPGMINHVGLYAAGTALSAASDPWPLPVVVAEWTADLVRPPIGTTYAENTGSALSPECRPVFRTVPSEGIHERFSLEIRDQQGRVGAARMRAAPVPEDGPVMSDLMLATLVTEIDPSADAVPDGFVRRGNRMIEPLLPRMAENGSAITVYFEVHELTATVRVEAALIPVDHREETAVSVSFTEEVAGGMWARDMILDLDGVKPGAYYLTVRVTDIPGNFPVMERSTTLDILSR